MLAAWLVWASAALATPVEMPAGEDLGLWRTALGLAGLEPVPASSSAPGARVRLWVQGDELSIWVRDIHGAEHRLTVPRPTDARGRESVAALVVSLVQPMRSAQLPALPALPAPLPPPVRPAPAPRAPEPEPIAIAPPPEITAPAPVLPAPVLPAPVRVALAPEPEPELALSAAPPAPTPRPPRLLSTSATASFGPSLRMRPSLRSTGALGAALGLVRGPWSVELGLEGALPARLLQVEVERRMAVVDLRLMPAWGHERWQVGPTLGLSARKTSDPWLPTPMALLPAGGLRLSHSLPLWSEGVALRLALLVEADLVPTRLPVDDELTTEGALLQPVSAGLSTALLFGGR